MWLTDDTWQVAAAVMWLKLALLSLYLVAVFVVSRVLEAMAWYPQVFCRSLHPAASHGAKCEEDPSPTYFSCGPHFYEEVEDTKDSAWLVQVMAARSSVEMLNHNPGAPSLPLWCPHRSLPLLPRPEVLVKLVVVFKPLVLCLKKGWTSSRLVLALPRGNMKAKEDVILHHYKGPVAAPDILRWVHSRMAARVAAVSVPEAWLDSTGPEEVRVLAYTALLEAPLLLSALAVRFTGRVKFGVVTNHPTVSKQPIYIVATPEAKHQYGREKGEHLNYHSMERYLRSLSPEMNDALLLSIFLTNLYLGFDLFLPPRRRAWQAARYALNLVRYNSLLFLGWLLVLTLYQFSFMHSATSVLTWAVRVLAQTPLAGALRHDWAHLYSLVFVALTYAAFGLGVLLCHRSNQTEQEEGEDPWWWTADSFPMNYLFRRSMRANYSQHFEVGVEMLIERLAVPHLWLQPIIPPDYIKDLPVWIYHPSSSSGDEDPTEVQPPSQTKQRLPTLLPCSRVQDGPKGSGSKLSTSGGETKAAVPLPLPPRRPPERVAPRPPANMRPCHDCPICLEDYQPYQEICGLPCGHSYHCPCIMSWLLRDNHCCPVCRQTSYPSHRT
ncbi:RNF103 [Cordylochernes scorpioides]|uniref:RNF103 n=1 Tax=Cordylochernes scorpioides TaxID=51811 RepID=A0ABY6LJK8_9ARAC|nr:RNF103 [Cordylochernes scorpioides]